MMRAELNIIAALTLAIATIPCLSGCEKLAKVAAPDDVSLVKSGRLEMDPSVTVGQALENYKFFNSVRWEGNVSPNGRRVVTFTGAYDLDLIPQHPSPFEWNATRLMMDMFRELTETNVATLTAIYDFNVLEGDSFMIAGCSIQPGFDEENEKTQMIMRKLEERDPPENCVKNLKHIYNNTIQ